MSAVVLDVVVVVDMTSVQRNHSDWSIRLFAEVQKFAKTDLDLRRVAFLRYDFRILGENTNTNCPINSSKNVLCKIFFCKLKKKKSY